MLSALQRNQAEGVPRGVICCHTVTSSYVLPGGMGAWDLLEMPLGSGLRLEEPVAELPGDMGKPGSLDSGLKVFSEEGSPKQKQEHQHPHHLSPLTHNILCWVSWEVQTSTDPCFSRRARANSCASVIIHTHTHMYTPTHIAAGYE